MREHGTKTTPVFLLADGEALWSLLPSSVFSLSGGTVKLENTYQKGSVTTLITATTSIHLPKLVSNDLTIRADSVLTNPIEKDGVRSWSM